MLQSPVFVTRKYPPMVGGMETFSCGVWRSVDASWPDATLIKNGGRQVRLLWWLPLTAVRLIARVLRGNVDYVLVGDALTYTALRPLLVLMKVPHATFVMGLDITWNKRLYRAVAHRALRRAPLVLAISAATADTAVHLARVDESKVRIVALGTAVPETGPGKEAARRALLDSLGLPAGTQVIVTLGRLVRRKGARWFVENVLTGLPTSVVYVLAGDGPERDLVGAAAEASGLHDRVRVLGRVDDDRREMLLRGADLFVQPNVPVPDDMEGFGLVTVEAAMRGTLTLASALEGICDAVGDGETGVLLPPGDAEAWVARLRDVLEDPEALDALADQYRVRTCERYSEQAMAKSLRELIDPADPTAASLGEPLGSVGLP